MAKTTTKRGPMVTIGVIALGSLGFAYALFWLFDSGVLNLGTTNHGRFVEPVVYVDELSITTREGEAFDPGGTWSLWLVDCREECAGRLGEMKTLHALLNKDAQRVRRFVVVSLPAIYSGTAVDEMLANYPKVKSLIAAPESLKEGVYTIDPRGQLVFHYEPGAPVTGILEDLKRLLKVSQIG